MAFALALSAVAVAGCGEDVRREFRVRYNVPGQQYDDSKAKRELDKCLRLPGASEGFTNQSQPPQPGVSFIGSESEADALELCLRRLPDAVVTLSR